MVSKLRRILKDNINSGLQIQLLFTNIIVEKQGNGNFKFAPTTFWNLKWWCFNDSDRVIETWMQLKYSALYHHPKILISSSTYINSPLVWLRSESQENIEEKISNEANWLKGGKAHQKKSYAKYLYISEIQLTQRPFYRAKRQLFHRLLEHWFQNLWLPFANSVGHT